MSSRSRHWLRRTAIVLGCLVGLFGLIQIVPYGRTHSNPRVLAEPTWDSPRTRELAVHACFDCHSNQSHVLWWERVAPLSWWITNHVDEGRGALNFSEWSTHRGHNVDDAIETINEGSMPPDYYTWLGMHSNANLTPKEKQELADGLRKTFAAAGIKG